MLFEKNYSLESTAFVVHEIIKEVLDNYFVFSKNKDLYRNYEDKIDRNNSIQKRKIEYRAFVNRIRCLSEEKLVAEINFNELNNYNITCLIPADNKYQYKGKIVSKLGALITIRALLPNGVLSNKRS
jgi:hypothetical protein